MSNFKICTSWFSKAKGLMFSFRENLVFVFDDERRRNLHMFFVFFPIDLLFLDKNKKIVEIKKDFKPFTFYNSKEKAQYVVELAVKDSFDKLDIGDIVSI